MAFLHADADSHCIYGMQRYGPTERAVALWGHEIAFSVLCTLPFRIIELTKTLRLFPPRPDVPFVLASLTVPVLHIDPTSTQVFWAIGKSEQFNTKGSRRGNPSDDRKGGNGPHRTTQGQADRACGSDCFHPLQRVASSMPGQSDSQTRLSE